MSEQERALPSRPNLRFLKIEAKRRQAAGEFTTLHDAQLAIAREHGQPSWAALKRLVEGWSVPAGQALSQLRWITARFQDAGDATWVAPDDAELRQRFDDQFLGAITPQRLVATLSAMGARLRTELVITEDTPTHAQARLDDRQIQAVVATEPPHRLIGLRIYRAGPAADPRVAAPTSRSAGEVPEHATEVAERVFGQLGLVGLVLAGGRPDCPVWTVARGWADLDRSEALRFDHRFPAHSITRLVTATTVLRLVAEGRLELDDAVRGLLTGDALLDDLVADTTGMSCPDAVGELVLAPLGMTGSSFSVRPADAVTGYRLDSDGMFEAVHEAVDGLWTTAADLVRFGVGWSSLLPEELVREALTPQGDGRMGLGWPLDRAGEIAGSPGRGHGGSVSLVIRLRDKQTHVAMTTRRIPVEPVNGQLLRHS